MMRPNCRALIASLLASLTWVSAARAQFLPDFHTDAKVDPRIIAATVPARSFSPVFRKVVEWLEYLMVVLVPVMAVWLLNVFTLVRNR